MIDGDKVITESDAVILYAIQKGGKKELLGRNIDERVTIATCMGILKDFHPLYVKLSYGSHGKETYEEAHKEYVEKFKPYLQKFTGILGEKKWMAG